jgi:hypothetical protein
VLPRLRPFLHRLRTALFGPPPLPDPPAAPAEPCDWCLVGNVVAEHPYGQSHEPRRGSKQFTPGTKVYCLPPQWGDGYERTVVVGRARGSKRWITVVMKTNLITHWRAKVVYQPAVLHRLRQGIDNHNAQWKSREEVESWAESLRHKTRAQ